MSSTSSPPFSIIAISGDRHTRVLKAHIIVHILVLSTVVLLLMQLISHATVVEQVEVFEMPPPWRKMFIRQLVEGTEMFSWVIVYLFVPLDGLHALLCIGWYADGLHPVRRTRNVGKRRRAIKMWLDGMRQRFNAWRQHHLASFETKGGQEDSPKPAHDTECRSTPPPPPQQPTPQNRTCSYWTENSETTPSPPSPLGPHTYHPLLHPSYTPLTRHTLLTLWDTIILLTLTSHIYIYTANISPSFAFCSQHDFPLWHFKPHSLTLQERCNRINWSIHSVRGCSATGAVVLALWHVCALVTRLWGVVDESSLSSLMGGRLTGFKSGVRARRIGGDDVGVGMLDWRCLPRDVDVKSRSTRRSSVVSGTLTGIGCASRHVPTVSQEELTAGMGRRRRWRSEEKTDTSSNSNGDKEIRSSRWSWRSEGFLECLA